MFDEPFVTKALGETHAPSYAQFSHSCCCILQIFEEAIPYAMLFEGVLAEFPTDVGVKFKNTVSLPPWPIGLHVLTLRKKSLQCIDSGDLCNLYDPFDNILLDFAVFVFEQIFEDG